MQVYCFDNDGNLLNNLTQWDIDQYVQIQGTGLTDPPKVHFCNKKSTKALVVESEISDSIVKVKVPNVLLEDDLLIFAYLYVRAPDVSDVSAKTQAVIRIPVRSRPKPSNHPYIEDIDYMSAVALDEKIAIEINEMHNDLLEMCATSLDEYKAETTLWFDVKADKEDVLLKGGKTEYYPVDSYNPATKKYVDDLVADFISKDGSGDMLRTMYDSDKSGVVDNSERLDGKTPEYYLNIDDVIIFDCGTSIIAE